MITGTIIGIIVIGLWLSNSTVTHKEDAKTTLCVGVCMSTEAKSIDGNAHDEHNPSVTKIVKDVLPGGEDE